MSQKIKECIVLTAAYYNYNLRPEVLNMHCEDLKDYDEQKVLNAYVAYRKDFKNRSMPLPAQIIQIMNPKMDSRDFANELARKIDKAVSKFGYAWQDGVFFNGERYFEGGGRYHWTFKEAVIAELGPLGWHAICLRGGWLSVRNSANEMEEGIFIAQMRDQLQSSYNLQQQGIDVTMIEMPSTKEQERVDSIRKLQLANSQIVDELDFKEKESE